jgi:hypothetical protein
MPDWKKKIWQDIFDMWEAQMIPLKDAEMLWALLDNITEEEFILKLMKRSRLKIAA